MTLENGCFPFYLSGGYLYYYHKNTKEIKGVYLLSHYWIFNWRESGDNEDGHKKYFMQNFQLQKYWNCMKVINFIKTNPEEYYERLGKESLKNLNIDVAEVAFRKAKNISLILTVQKLRDENEKKILLGHIAAILGDETLAQDFFKESSNPSLALDMRIDLQDWNIALKLAREYKPYKEPFISRKLAFQYETQGSAAEAIKLYERSVILNINEFLVSQDDDYDRNDVNEHNTQCYAGIARCSFRLGDTTRGLELSTELNDKNLIIEAASLCESLNYLLEAAKLYSQVSLFEKAATIYIQLKHFKSAESLIDKIKSPKLLIQLAKMKEAERLYKDAEIAYENANDWESVIRINLKFLDNPTKAKDILFKKCKTETAALMLSDYYESKGKKKETIEFKLIAKKYDEAFAIAQSYNEMDTYSDYILKNVKNIEEFKKIAHYYEGKNQFGKSGVFYEKCGSFNKALKMYIKGMNDEYLEKAVEMVGNTKDDTLINEMIDHLLGTQMESGPHYLTKLYILLGNYKQACEIAVNLAAQVSNNINILGTRIV
jgi:WD repeat-containing protein 19